MPTGTPKFLLGFRHGCGSILHDRGNLFYRTRFEHYFDQSLIDDFEYLNGYKRGHSYCFQYSLGANGLQAGGPDKFLFPTENFTPFTNGMGSGNINNTVNYAGGSALDWGFGKDVSGGGLNGSIGVLSKSYREETKAVGGNGGVFGSHPLWGTPSRNQIFGGVFGE
jgi:hypothetical protein